MMKKVLAVLAVVGLASVSASAGGFGVFGAYMDTDDAGAGIGGGIKFKSDISESLAFELRGSYIANFDPDVDVELVYDDLVVIPVEADLLLTVPLGDQVQIYGGGGGGYYVLPEYEVNIAVPGSDQPDLDWDDVFGYFGVAGIQIKLSDTLSLFGEAQYRVIEIDKAEVDGVEEDVDPEVELTGLGANAGLLFVW
jgi:opacity protein-like surface antigen